MRRWVGLHPFPWQEQRGVDVSSSCGLGRKASYVIKVQPGSHIVSCRGAFVT
jgi:hypothetical protein